MLSTPYLFNEIYDVFSKAPYYTIVLEVALVFIVIWLILHKKKSTGKQLTNEEKAAFIEKFVPEPLVADVPIDHIALFPKIVTGKVGKKITIDGNDCLNIATHNYLGLLDDESIQNKAAASIRKYGVGSCGPRGFYGTVDVHLTLEERLAKFMQTEEAIVYSYGFSTIASAIPAYSKRGDIIFADEKVNFAVQKGLDASRSEIIFFKHNDMADLERILKEQDKKDKKNPKKAMKSKHFLVAEGIYMNTGEMCPLKELIKLRQTYKLRFFLDESLTFGTLGINGRGLTEHFNVDNSEIDVISASLEWAAGTIGGFCVGSTFIVEHQRLSGLGYCFSASLPPLLTQAAISALDQFESDTNMFVEYKNCAEKMSRKLSKLSQLTIKGHELSPVKHLYLNDEQDFDIEREILYKIVDKCIDNKLGVITATYLDDREKTKIRPSIRITVNRKLTDADIDFAYNTLEKCSKDILQ